MRTATQYRESDIARSLLPPIQRREVAADRAALLYLFTCLREVIQSQHDLLVVRLQIECRCHL